jgi:hypothetical protein
MGVVMGVKVEGTEEKSGRKNNEKKRHEIHINARKT